MRTATVLSIILIVIGFMVFGNRDSTCLIREKIVDLGNSGTGTDPFSPSAGFIVLLGGIALMPMGRKEGIPINVQVSHNGH